MSPLDDALNPPLLTADLPGIGGQIKSVPEDFEVDEIPAYEPSGQGDFLYLWIEKRDMGAEYFQRQIARRLDIAVGDVGAAGLKDRRAVTRQWISVPVVCEPRLPQLEGDGIRVLQVSRHTNKLRAGHLRGNRFRVLIRGVGEAPDPEAQASALRNVIECIRTHGLPNYYGQQRFGRDGETLHLGLAALGGQKRVTKSFLKKLALSAAQAALFNRYLARRQRDGLLPRVLPGDVMCKLPFGGMFVAEDVDAEQRRFDLREIVHAGPIFGRKTFASHSDAARREQDVLSAFNLQTNAFSGFGKLLQGTRRHNLIYVDDLAAANEADGLRLTFTMPAGSYATVLLRELMKSEGTLDESEHDDSCEL
jgi:tRNA pseudouridine13 synthase